jgi:hypothetical protein
MRDGALPAAHGAWLVLLTGLLLGTLVGGTATAGSLALALTAIATFCAGERLVVAMTSRTPHPTALRSGLVALSVAAIAGIWTLVEVGPMRLIWLIPIALGLVLLERQLGRSKKRRKEFEFVGMVGLVLTLPAASIATGCPIGWPIAALSLAFLIHVGHAVFRTHAHLQPKNRIVARWVSIGGGVAVAVLVWTGGLAWPIGAAVMLGLFEPWAPHWSPLPAKAIGRRETLLILALPLAWLIS